MILIVLQSSNSEEDGGGRTIDFTLLTTTYENKKKKNFNLEENYVVVHQLKSNLFTHTTTMVSKSNIIESNHFQ